MLSYCLFFLFRVFVLPAGKMAGESRFHDKYFFVSAYPGEGTGR